MLVEGKLLRANIKTRGIHAPGSTGSVLKIGKGDKILKLRKEELDQMSKVFLFLFF